MEVISDKDFFYLLKIISGMPLEFFSLEVVTPDKEALQAAAFLIDLISREKIQEFA